MTGDELKQYLDRNGVHYSLIAHEPRYTAQEVAGVAHVPGKQMAKTVIVKVDGRLAMVVLPASDRVVFDMLREALDAGAVELAGEREFMDAFPGCERGAMPPLGNLYGLPVYVADDLAEDDEIAFNAGSFTELIRMRYRDFDRLVQPAVLHFSTQM